MVVVRTEKLYFSGRCGHGDTAQKATYRRGRGVTKKKEENNFIIFKMINMETDKILDDTNTQVRRFK